MRLSTIILGVLAVAACGDGTGPSNGVSTDLSLGSSHSCQIVAGGIRCWGRGVEGQLGIGTAAADAPPTLLSGAPTLVALAAGYTHTCGIDAAGAAWCWGSDIYGELGTDAAGDGTCAAEPCRTAPTPVNSALRFRALAAGRFFTCGIATDDTVYCWGLNDKGQLGSRQDTSCGGILCSAIPVQAAMGDRFKSITAGYAHVCGVDQEGRAICWGYTALSVAGQHVHDGFLSDTQSFGGGLRFASLSAGGYHTCGIARSGESWCWGIDAVGAGPTILEAQQPTLVSGAHHFTMVRSARFAACGLDDHGQVFCWGPDVAGELGTGDPAFQGRYDVPTPIASALRFTSLAGGGSNFCGTATDGALYCWGAGVEGQLGSGHSDSPSPVAVGG